MSPQQIEELRIDLCMKVMEFCQAVGISKATYHLWINGETHPTAVNLAKMLKLKQEVKNSLFTRR